MRWWRSYAIGFLVLSELLIAQPVGAMCMAGIPICQQFWMYAAVFQGRVTDIVEQEGDAHAREKDQRPYRRVTFQVEHVWRGDVGAQVTLHLPGTRDVWIEDAFEPVTGREYIIFASRFPNRQLWTNRCAPNVPGSLVDSEVLAFLASLSRPSPGGRIFGSVYDQRNPRVPGSPWPTVDTRITIRGSDMHKSMKTRHGWYEFDRLTPGHYTVTMTSPKGVSGVDVSLQVDIPDPHACARRDFSITGPPKR